MSYWNELKLGKPTGIKLDGQQPPFGATPEQLGRQGGWISTYLGVPFWPMDPRIEDVRAADIAHALSRQCRFAGHCDRFYSVAQHCVHVSELVPFEHALWALLHDAPEAYLVDLPRPIKHSPGIGEAYQEVEANLMRVICRKFGLPFAEPASVKQADIVMLETERRDLHPRARWTMDVTPREAVIQPWSPDFAEYAFTQRLEELEDSRDLVTGA